MSDSPSRLFADDRGVWREELPHRPFGIEWNEITRVVGYKLDGITEIYTVVELDHPSGHWIELNSCSQGFGQVIDAITARLPGIRQTWFTEIDALGVRALPLTVWQRATPA